jgi:hypothetical protein
MHSGIEVVVQYPPANNPMHPSGEVGRFQIDNLSSPPGDWGRSSANQQSRVTFGIATFTLPQFQGIDQQHCDFR